MVPIRRLLARELVLTTEVSRVITRFPLLLSSLTLGKVTGLHLPVAKFNAGMSLGRTGLVVPQVLQGKVRGYRAACTHFGATRLFPADQSTSFSMEVLGAAMGFVAFRE